MNAGRFLLSLAVLNGLAVLGPPAQAQPTRFQAPADLFYLHPLVNYKIPLQWQARWERERLSTNGVQATVGSISTKDFTTLAQVDVNAPANDHLRLVYRLDWTDSPHLDGGERQDWIGLELGGLRTRAGRWGVETVVHAPSAKSEVDLVASLVWTDASRERYLRIGRRTDDFLFAEKTRDGGLVDAGAYGPTWAAHSAWGPWSVSSEGTVLRRQERRFPDSELSPDVAASSLQRDWSSSAVRFAGARSLIELRVEHRDFESEQVNRDAPSDRNASQWRHASLAFEHTFAAHWRLRAQLHRSHYDQDLDATAHRRREKLGGAFLERTIGRGHAVEIGWMATDHEWTTTPADDRYGPDREGFSTKVGLGWTYALGDRGWYRVTLSHEPDPQQFGGANMQAQMNF